MAANRWGLGCESLEDAGRESQHAVKSRIQPKIAAPRIIIFQKSKIIVAPTIAQTPFECNSGETAARSAAVSPELHEYYASHR